MQTELRKSLILNNYDVLKDNVKLKVITLSIIKYLSVRWVIFSKEMLN